MTAQRLTGRCHCGAVRFRVAGAPLDVDICYCADCARAVGSVLTAWARFPSDALEFTRGEPARYASSPGVTRTFCGSCGSSLTYRYPDRAEVDVATSVFDDPDALPPRSEGPGRPRWLPPIDGDGT